MGSDHNQDVGRDRNIGQDALTLLLTFADRIPAATLTSICEDIYGGEPALALDQVTAELQLGQMPITATERELVREILYGYDREKFDEYFVSVWKRDEIASSLNIDEHLIDLPAITDDDTVYLMEPRNRGGSIGRLIEFSDKRHNMR